jgi:putative DNA primase/helicase
MNRATAEWIDRARAVDIGDMIVQRSIKLRGRGQQFWGPCPRCGGRDRFGIHIGKQVFHCRGCGGHGHGAIDLIMFLDNVTFREAIEVITGERQPQPPTPQPARPTERGQEQDEAGRYERQQHHKARWLWSKRQPITGTIAEHYLRTVRGYYGVIPPTLAFLEPSARGRPPALISAFATVGEIEPGVLAEPRDVDSVHLTLLRPDGSDKANTRPNKLCIGSPLGRPIVLAPPNDLLGMAVAEGIEDGLAAHAGTGLGVWAAGSAGFMPPLADMVPSYIEAVTIYAHADPAGQRGAEGLAQRLHAREVFIEGLR